MAQTRTVKLQVDATDAVKEIRKVASEIDVTGAELRRKRTIQVDAAKASQTIDKLGDKLDKDLKPTIKKIDKQVEDVIETTEEVGEAAEGSSNGFKLLDIATKGFGTALKGLGIGLVISAFVKLGEALNKNQVFADQVGIALETVSIAFQGIINTVVEKGQKVVNFFGNVGSKITKFFKKDIDGLNSSYEENNQQTETAFQRNKRLAKEIVELRKQVQLQEAEQRKLQLTYQREAELQRQIRDNTSLTIEERIEANNKLATILNKQLEDERFIANEKIRLAKLELSTNAENQDAKIKLINAEADLAEVEERITSQRSENKTNEIALQNEFIESQKSEVITLQATGVQKLEIADNTNAEILQGAKQTQDALVEIEKQGADGRIKIDRALAETRRNIVAQSLGDVASLLGEQSKAGKALAVGQALINTYSAAAAALAPPPIGAGPIFGPIAAIGAVAAGMANVKQILSTKLPGVTGGGDDGPDPAVPPVPQGLGPQNVNMEAIEQPEFGTGQPTQAFVVENDISNAQALQQELDLQSTL